MSIAMPAIAAAPPTAAEPVTAAALAARIPVPVRLPIRYDGQPLRHLSHSSYTLWVTCREAWRRKYICGEREAPSGAMFLGSRVDDAMSDYYRRQLAGERLSLDQVKDAYRELWHKELEAEQEKLDVDWTDIHPQAAFEIGLQALDVTFEQLVPKLGEPVAVQRELKYTLVPSLEWTILCYLDLETRGRALTGDEVLRIVDYKVKNKTISARDADRDMQASVYLAGRWLKGQTADEFSFAQIAKPGPNRKQMSATLVTTKRSTGQLRATLARIALAASEIAATYERLGPERPWGFADPTSWRCSSKFCSAWNSCPGGRGL
ncbi:MAG: PD-(D/E)XK nuclease family protein [Solirubrobacterales bacterium]|nr:PD-(D/E)XK nuclease family protein [Solirubrobacterales bacterium]